MERCAGQFVAMTLGWGGCGGETVCCDMFRAVPSPAKQSNESNELAGMIFRYVPTYSRAILPLVGDRMGDAGWQR